MEIFDVTILQAQKIGQKYEFSPVPYEIRKLAEKDDGTRVLFAVSDPAQFAADISSPGKTATTDTGLSNGWSNSIDGNPNVSAWSEVIN